MVKNVELEIEEIKLQIKENDEVIEALEKTAIIGLNREQSEACDVKLRLDVVQPAYKETFFTLSSRDREAIKRARKSHTSEMKDELKTLEYLLTDAAQGRQINE